MKAILKYLRLYKAFFSTGLIVDLEYRSNFISKVIVDIIWYGLQIIFFEVLFSHTSSMSGWTLEKTKVFLGLLFVTDSVFMIVLSDNLDGFTNLIKRGDLDLLLTKPVSSQFMISFQKVSVSLIPSFAISSSYFIYSVYHLPNLQWERVLWLLLFVPCGLICLYSIRFMLSATSVLFSKADHLQFLWYSAYHLGTKPDAIYPPWIRFLLMSVLPVSMVASVPARFVTEEPDWWILVWTIFWSLSLLQMTRVYWKFVLRRYVSASS